MYKLPFSIFCMLEEVPTYYEEWVTTEGITYCLIRKKFRELQRITWK